MFVWSVWLWFGIKLWCGKYLEIDNFIVHPEHRKKGIGKDHDMWMLKPKN
jgi:GNAT superfamily N-acetyltransferase